VWYCDTLLVGDRVALCVGDIKTLLLGDRVAFSYWDLVRDWLTLGDRDESAQFSWDRMAFCIREGMTLMMRFRVTLGPSDRVTVTTRLGVRNIDTFLAGYGFTLL